MNQVLSLSNGKIKQLGILTMALLSLSAPKALAGGVTVVTVGDSSAGGTANFEIPGGGVISAQTLETAGRSVLVNIGNFQLTAVSQATAVANSTITQAQATQGIGAGGAVLTGSATLASVIVNALDIATISSLANSAALSGITVITASNVEITVAQAFINLNNALQAGATASGANTLLPTAVNDAVLVLRAAILQSGGRRAFQSGNSSSELRDATRVLTNLLREIRQAEEEDAAEEE